MGERYASAVALLHTAAAAVPGAGTLILGRTGGRAGAGEWWTLVEVDGHLLRAPAEAKTLEATLASAGFTLEDGDRIVILAVTGTPVGEVPPRMTPAAAPSLLANGRAATGAVPPDEHAARPARLAVRRAVPFSVLDASMPMRARSAAATVGEALQALSFQLYPEDRLTPAADAPLVPGLRVTIWRATPVTIAGKDLRLDVRSQATTVGELLAEQALDLGPLDRIEPDLAAPLEPHSTVQIVRAREEETGDLQLLPYETQYQADPLLPAGWQQRVQTGVAGLVHRVVRVLYEDDEPIGEEVVASIVEREPRPEVIRYGTGPTLAPAAGAGRASVPQASVALPVGFPLEIGGYRVRQVLLMEATGYDPGPVSTGKRPGDRGYGITASGIRAGYGVVATDPRVIPFFTRLYVPGYGFGIAGDTGGAIQGLRIDLGYDTYEEALAWGRRMVQVYILE